LLLPLASLCATVEGWYLSCLIASWTCKRFFSLTEGALLITRETVAIERPARWATSVIEIASEGLFLIRTIDIYKDGLFYRISHDYRRGFFLYITSRDFRTDLDGLNCSNGLAFQIIYLEGVSRFHT